MEEHKQLIGSEIEIYSEEFDDILFDIYLCGNFFIAENKSKKLLIRYEITKKIADLTEEQKTDILDTVLGVSNYPKEEEVRYLDIFLHGEFINKY